jgi:hypothetical protein
MMPKKHLYSHNPLAHLFFRASTRITEIKKMIMKNGARNTPKKTPVSTDPAAGESETTVVSVVASVVSLESLNIDSIAKTGRCTA